MRNVVAGAAVRAVFKVVNRYLPWYRLPVRLGLLNVEALRYVLRARNLLDSEVREAPPQARPVPPAPPGEDVRVSRTFDGTSNDLSAPEMGSVGSAFGRNLRPDLRPDLFDEPSPITVSQQLLHRDTFLPARSLNLLAAAWIQFQVHDWVDHARYPLGQADVRVPLPPGMTWSNTPGGPPEPEMRIAGNIPFPGPGRNPMSPVFPNATTPWWDGSEVYGADLAKSNQLREGAKLRLTPEGYLPDDVSGLEITGFNESWWLGLGSLHTLFAREHNLLCDELRLHYPDWSDERVYQTARLIVSALIAKIHTVEWTPAILGTEVIDIGLNTNWNGPPAHDWLTRLGIWLIDSHASVGIPKTTPDHDGVPYSLTEDFVTVYRMHPLLPDDYRFVDHRTGAALGNRGFPDIQGAMADVELRKFGLENTLYSFGLSYPGAITLHNYPRSLQKFERNGELIDMSVVDLVRTRRRGVPRYNDFRAGLHKPRIKHWEELCENTGIGSPDEGDLPQRRRGRHDGGPVRGDSPGGVRVLRHRVPYLHPDGLAAAAERPLPHRRLPPGDLLAVRHGLDRQQRHDQHHPSPLPGPGRHPAPHGERVRPVAAGHRTRSPAGSRRYGGHREEDTEMTEPTTTLGNAGLDALKELPLLTSIWRRRTHRVSRGTSIDAGSMSWASSEPRTPLTELEEAVLISLTGCTGLTMPDRPFTDPRDHKPIMAKPNLNMVGRTAGSPDNAQGTHFIMINDTGTYFLRKLPPPEDGTPSVFDPETLIARAAEAKVRLLDHRVDVPGGNRDFPAYLDSNRFLSNLPGTTVMFPVVDLSRQYINGMMYLLTQPDGARPAIVDDRNFYRPAGVKKWIKSGFLNNDIKLPLGTIWSMRTQIEADLLLQNIMLTANAMGLGAWIHASIAPPVLLGEPTYRAQYGAMLGFDWSTPKWKLADIVRWQVPLPKYAYLRDAAVGLRHQGEYLIKAMCPPNYPTMADAVDAVVAEKFGPGGIYADESLFARIYRGEFGAQYLRQASDYAADVIACARDICTYIYETHGRFPAHCDTIHVPGVWLQAHHVEEGYYEKFFRNGLTEEHVKHDQRWHPTGPYD